MDDGLKQRLIGAVVLVTTGVIFIPMLFDESSQRPQNISQQLPTPPDVAKLEVAKPSRPASRQENAQTPVPDTEATAGNDTPSSQEAAQGDSPAYDENALPFAWTVQLASFEDTQNAEALRDRLRKSGYKAYIKYRPEQQPALIRVYVGPELDREAADKLQQSLKSEFALNGIVTRYQP